MSAVISKRFNHLGTEDPSKNYRLGIMGGTFDPIHIGHLACAEQVRDELDLDAVIFVVAGVPVYKKGRCVSSAQDRITMCERAIKDNSTFDVSRIEIDRKGDTYTVDTLRQMRAHYPENVEFYFITGIDAAVHVCDWKESAEVAHLAHFVAVSRPGCEAEEEILKHLSCLANFSVHYQEVTALAISSSDLRKRVKEGLSIKYLTPQSVLDYIEKQGLYRASDDALCEEE